MLNQQLSTPARPHNTLEEQICIRGIFIEYAIRSLLPSIRLASASLTALVTSCYGAHLQTAGKGICAVILLCTTHKPLQLFYIHLRGTVYCYCRYFRTL